MIRFFHRHRFESIVFIFGFLYMLFFCRYGLDVEDEGWFLYASKLISQGHMPYKDFSLHTTPGSLYMQGFIFRLFDPTVIVGRYSMVFLGLFVAIMLFYLSNQIYSSRYLALISSIIFIFWGVPHIRYPWYGWYALGFGIIVPYFMFRYLKSKKKIYIFFTGISCSLTFLMKQNMGTSVICAVFAFFIIKNLLLNIRFRQKAWGFMGESSILLFGVAIPLGLVLLYFHLHGALDMMLYYIFKHASQAAWNRFIFIPFPHIKSSTMYILLIYLIFCYCLYGYIWKKKKLVCGFITLLIPMSMLIVWFLFIKKIDSVDSIYILDRLKTGFINGFFNLCMLAVIFSGFIFVKDVVRKKEVRYENLALLFVVIFSIFYIWSSLCISRDHLHLILGLAPSYVLIPFLMVKANDKISYILRNKHADMIGRYSRLIAIYLPLLCICFIGYFSALKNEGHRSIFPSMTQMRSTLDIKNAKGIILSKQDKDMISDMVKYISQNTTKYDRIFDTFKSTLFYFLSDRDRQAFHLVLTSDVMRQDEQESIIENLKNHEVKLVITEKPQWDNAEHYRDPMYNPLTFKVWAYIIDHYEKKKDFGKYYILEKPTR